MPHADEPQSSNPAAGVDLIELYGARTGNCIRVAVAIEEAGLPYVVRRVDLRRGEHLGDEYRSINPQGKVPTMVEQLGDRRMVMSQSNAILMHVAGRAQGRLLPPSGNPRALAMERFFFILTDVIAPSHSAFRLRLMGEPGGEALERHAADTLAQADRMLEEAPFLSGEIFGLADVAAVTTLPSLIDPLRLESLPHLSAWYERASRRPSVLRGLRAFDMPERG